MADKTTQLIVEGLSRAVAEPAGLPLVAGKNAGGVFAATAPAKQAAQQCKDEGYLHVLRTETKGKATQEICAITEKGIAFLLSQVSPKEVLQEFVRAVEGRKQQVGELVDGARRCQATLDALKAQVERVLQQVKPAAAPTLPAPPPASANGPGPWKGELLAYLTHWQSARSTEDCPLPDLYRKVRQTAPSLSVGAFHDGLRQLHEQGEVYLHPWTGPMYEIPEPAYALVHGHAVAYYASRKI